MLNRITRMWQRLQTEERKALVPFITCGFPVINATVYIVRAFEEAGASFIELGMPFSDPLADGPTIQYSSQMALKNRVSLKVVFKTVEQIRQRSRLPILVMGYLNPIWNYGVEFFARDAAQAGIDGLIIADLPVEESQPIKNACRNNNLSIVFLVAPTTPARRIHAIDCQSTDFSYCVSSTSVTGGHKELPAETQAFLERVRKNSRKPFVVGFGVRRPEQVRELKTYCDGIVIGSALIDFFQDTDSTKKATMRAQHLLQQIYKELHRP